MPRKDSPKAARVCEHCGALFEVFTAIVKTGKGRYCSRACSGAARATPITVRCVICGGNFISKPSLIKRGNVRYCSERCMGLGKRAGSARVCPGCGITFYASPSSRRHAAVFCSSRCYGKMKRRANETSRSTWEYREWRDAVYRRDRYTCQRCGQVGGQLNAHHIKGWTAYPALRFDVANGVTLCEPCHWAEHATHSPHLLSSVRERGRSI